MRVSAGLAICLLIGGCGIRSDSGIDALLQVQRSDRGQAVVTPLQFVRAPLPPPSVSIAVAQATTPATTVWPGLRSVALSGTLENGGRSLLLSADGDVGYWILPAGSADDVNFDQLRYDAQLGFSPRLLSGPLPLHLQAVDQNGQPGPLRTLQLQVTDDPLTPSGPLVVSLRWSSDADLDLRVVTPTLLSGQKSRYLEISSRKKTALQPPEPGSVIMQSDIDAAGKLDFDSNAQCVLDGRREENIYWTQTPPRGRYLVRVDSYSMCRQAAAIWQVEVRQDGQLKYRAAGQSSDVDTNFTHEEGAGLLALEFTY